MTKQRLELIGLIARYTGECSQLAYWLADAPASRFQEYVQRQTQAQLDLVDAIMRATNPNAEVVQVFPNGRFS